MKKQLNASFGPSSRACNSTFSNCFSNSPNCRSASAIVRSYLMFKPYGVFVSLAAVFAVLALVPMVRFVVLWAIHPEHTGNVQSLIFGAIMSVAALLSLALGVLADLLRTNRRILEDQLQRTKEIQYRR